MFMNNYFFEPDDNELKEIEQEELAKLSPQKKRDIQKLFIILLSIGLVIGIICSFALIKVINKFGLTDKTPQFERIEK